MGLQNWIRWARACAWGSVALYAAFVLASPLLHHDMACHRTSPTHCPSCVASVAGPDIPSAAAVAPTALIDAGATPDVHTARPIAARTDQASGRAPPILFA